MKPLTQPLIGPRRRLSQTPIPAGLAALWLLVTTNESKGARSKRQRSTAVCGAGMFALAISSVLTLQTASASEPSLDVKLSIGGSWQQRNDVQIPNNETATRFSLDEAVDTGALPLVRLDAKWAINDRHGVRVLLAPLEYTESADFDEVVRFAGESFDTGEPVDATYRFNSWRVGYFYTLKNTATTLFRIGGTLKIRDAEIRLSQGAVNSFDDDVGLVPLLYLAGEYRLTDRWTLGADLDGLAGGPGRAIDAGVALDYKLSTDWHIGVEARLLDGGADVDDVFNFATFTSAALSLRARF